MSRDTKASVAAPTHGEKRQNIADRFRALTRLPLNVAMVGRLPVMFLLRPAPPPTRIVKNLRVSRRTHQVMRAFLQRKKAQGPWTWARLAKIPGIGMTSIVEILEAMRASRPRNALSETERMGRASGELFIQQAVDLVAEAVPATEAEIVRRLAAAGLAAACPNLAALERAVRFWSGALPFAVLRRPGLSVAVPVAAAEPLRALYNFTRRTLAREGLGSVMALAARVGVADLHHARFLIATGALTRWLDVDREWFWEGRSDRGVPREVARRVAAAAFDADELSDELGARGGLALHPPPQVLVTVAAELRREWARREAGAGALYPMDLVWKATTG